MYCCTFFTGSESSIPGRRAFSGLGGARRKLLSACMTSSRITRVSRLPSGRLPSRNTSPPTSSASMCLPALLPDPYEVEEEVPPSPPPSPPPALRLGGIVEQKNDVVFL